MDRDTGTVVHTAKALTTQYDLTVGIRNCMDALGFESWQQIDMVSLSTTPGDQCHCRGKRQPGGASAARRKTGRRGACRYIR